jgi:hypothetical protein
MMRQDKGLYYYKCQFCKWDTIKCEYTADQVNQLLMRVNYYKGRYMKDPQKVIYDKLLEVYKFNQEEQIKSEKF